ncbi:MAG: PTS sugar transporter subunit IIA [Chloroflexi bacterium]|nr:PTS sugar transporter subunit IIA [Chloroflexota bacterium]
MAEGMLDAARMIVGKQDGIVAVNLREEDSVESLMDRIAAAIEEVDHGDGVLILVDVFGASPFNASARLAVQRDQIEVISGVSLPMLLELAVQREGQSLTKLVEVAREAGMSGIRTLSETLDKKPVEQ